MSAGVLLLNSVLTVKASCANAHKDRGWEKITDAIIRHLNNKTKCLVFMLWGSYAQKKGAHIDKVECLRVLTLRCALHRVARSMCQTFIHSLLHSIMILVGHHSLLADHLFPSTAATRRFKQPSPSQTADYINITLMRNLY